MSFPINKRNFGVIETDENAASVYLYKRGRVQYTGQLNLGTGLFATTMSAFVDETELPSETEDVAEQKLNSMRALQAIQQL